MKVAYVGIDILFPALTNLYETGVEIVKVITCETDNYTEFNTQTIQFANDHGIPVVVKMITKQDLYELVEKGCEFVLVGGYCHRIPVIPELKIVNIHPALLPLGRGAWPMPLTILKGLNESGVTMHQMEETLDTGKILIQKKCPVYPNEDDLKTLSERQLSLIPNMVKELVSNFDELWENAQPQGEGEYWKMPSVEQCTVTSDMPFEEVDLILRAFKGYECFYINMKNNEKYEIIDGVAFKYEKNINIHPTNLKLKDGYIICERIKRV